MITRAFRRHGPRRNTISTTLVIYDYGVRVDRYNVVTRKGEFFAADHEWFDAEGKHRADLTPSARETPHGPEMIDQVYGEIVGQLLATKSGAVGMEISPREVGDLDAFIRTARRRQVSLSDDEAESAVARLIGSDARYRDEL